MWQPEVLMLMSKFLAENQNLFKDIPQVEVTLPRTLVITTDYYDQFIEENKLQLKSVEEKLSTSKELKNNLQNQIKGLNYQPIRHILNSAGINNYHKYQFDMVRIGIGMLGISGDEEMSKKLQRTVSFKTVISQISEVEA
jgi:hypothetical protein